MTAMTTTFTSLRDRFEAYWGAVLGAFLRAAVAESHRGGTTP
jgi:hypothetical protein